MKVNAIEDKQGSTWAGNQRPTYDAWLAEKTERRLWSYQSCMSHGCGACGDATTDSYFTGWPSRVIDSSAVQDRCQPWLSFEYAIAGELYFTVSYQLSTAWNSGGQCAFSGSGDGTIFYPGKPSIIGGTKDIPVESIRMKMIREGMEDYEYLVLAAKKDAAKAMAIAKALFPSTYGCAQPAAKLEAARAELFGMLDQPVSGGGKDGGVSGGADASAGADAGVGVGADASASGGAGAGGGAGASPGAASGDMGGCSVARENRGDWGKFVSMLTILFVAAAVRRRRA